MSDNPLDDFEDIIPEWDDLDEDAVPESLPAPALVDVSAPASTETPIVSIAVDPIEDPLDTSRIGMVQAVIEDLILALQSAKAVLLSQNVLVDREAFIANLQRIADGIPKEVRTARWMAREREAFIERTNEKARDVTERARKRSKELVSKSYVLAEAVEEANGLIRNAESEARTIRLQAEDFTEDRMSYLEQLFSDFLQQSREARLPLHEARPPSPDVPL